MKFQNLLSNKHLLHRSLREIFLLCTLILPSMVSADDLIVPQDLVNEVNQSYVARAIIGLKVADVQPEGMLSSAAAVDEQRSDIAQTQDSFLDELTKSVWGELNGTADGTSETPKIKAEVEFTTIPYLVLNVDEWMLAKIKESTKVASIQLDEMIPLSLAQSVPLVGADKSWARGYSGLGYAVAVLDTGVDKNHPMLSGKVIAEACYSTTSSQTQSVCPNGTNTQVGTGAGVPCSASLSGCNHGTHVAGIVAGNSSLKGVAKDTNIVAVQVFSRYGSSVTAWTSDIIKGLEYVLSLHRSNTKIASVNMSLGTSAVNSVFCDSAQSATKSAIDNLRSVGIATIIASGNSSSSSGISSPACISSAISVGATDKSDVVASYSNSASILKLLAPGSSITSSIPGSSTSAFNGTSMAAPHVAGAFAVLKSAAPNATVNEILACLEQTGKPIRDGRNGITKPRIQVDAALNCLLPTPNIGGSPTSLNFGNVNVDSLSSAQTVTLTNTGNAALNIGAMNVSSTEFTIQNNNCANKAVAASGSCTFQVVFAPKSAGTKASNVTIASNDPDTATFSITLTGVGVASCSVTATAGTGGSISPSGLKTLACGTSQTYGITAAANFKISNVLVDNASVGAVTSYVLSCSCPDGKNVTKTIAASFAALVPNITVNPTSGNFGQVTLNNTSTAQSFAISNTGDANLQLGSLSVSSSEFILTDSCSNKSIAPKASCSVSVAFKPQAEGVKTGNLSIASNDPDTATLNVPLQGEGKKGVPIMTVSPNLTIDFGSVEVGQSSASETITVSNTGTAVLYVTGINLSGANATDFTIVSNCSYRTLTPTQTCTVELQFRPGTEGDKSAAITFNSSISGISPVTVPLIGKGIPVIGACSEKPTITSLKTGGWNDRTIWDANRVPNTNDIVLVKQGHNVTLPYYYWTSMKGLCNHGTIWSGTGYWSWWYWRWWYYYYASYSHVYASSFIDNYGEIKGINNITNFPWWWYGRRAGSIYLYTGGEFKNFPKALVKGGDGISLGSYGGSGGGVYVRAKTIINYGTYGTPEYGAILGGHGANGSYAGGHGGWAYAIAYNGYLKNGGIICAGNGGSGYYAGIGGYLYVNGIPYTLLNGGTVCTGKNGSGRIDPNVISLAGKDTKVTGGDIAIFGGKDFVIDLTDMSEGAISAETLTLAVGEGGIIDLRGSNAKVLSVTGELKIFSDNIMLDEGVTIEDVVKAGKITIAPAKILRDMSISGSEVVAGKAGETLPIKALVTNTGPETDTYTVSVSNSKGWNLSSLPSTITVESQQTAELDLNVSLPTTEGENTIIITVTSQGDAEVVKTLEMKVYAANKITELVVTDEGTVDTSPITEDLTKGGDTSKVDENGELIGTQPIGAYNATGVIKDKSGNPISGVTVKAGEQTSVTDEAGKWSIGGLDSGSYVFVATKENYSFLNVEVSLEGDNTDQSVNIAVLSEPQGPYTTAGTLKDKAGNPIANATVQVGDKTTTTDELGNWSVDGLFEGTYDVVATKDNLSCINAGFELGNEDYHQVVSCEPITTLKMVVKPSSYKALNQDDTVTYTIDVINGGEQTATGVTLSNLLPEGTTLIALESVEGQCDNTTLVCTLPDLATGHSARVKLTLRADQANTVKTTMTLTSNEYPVDVKQNFKAVKPYLSTNLVCTPNSVVMQSSLHCQVVVELSALAPEDTATSINLIIQLPVGTKLADINTEYGNCDSSSYPTVTCQLNDLSIAKPDSISRAVVNVDMQLVDAGLLVLTHEAKVSAANYPAHTDRERTEIIVPPDAVADITLAIDTTISMVEEFNALIKGVEQFIIEQAGKSAIMPTVLLLEFKDNVDYRYFGNNMKELLKAVHNLKVGGGGLCPEASVEALTLAEQHTKRGGIIFISTDAPPYSDTEADIEAFKQKVIEKGITYTPVVSPSCTSTGQ